MIKLILCSVLLMTLVASEPTGIDDCEIDNHKLGFGDTYIPKSGDCTIYTCSEDARITALTCAYSISAGDCKHFPQDLSKPYPDCCERYECDDDI